PRCDDEGQRPARLCLRRSQARRVDTDRLAHAARNLLRQSGRRRQGRRRRAGGDQEILRQLRAVGSRIQAHGQCAQRRIGLGDLRAQLSHRRTAQLLGLGSYAQRSIQQAAPGDGYVRTCVSDGLWRGGGEVRGCVFAKRQLGGSQPSLLERAEGGGGVEGVMEDTMRTLFLSLVFLFVTAGGCFVLGFVFFFGISADCGGPQSTPPFIFLCRVHG